MAVLVDTSVWSQVLRRQQPSESSAIAEEFSKLVRQNNIEIIAAIRQEVLSGIRNDKHYESLRNYLRAFVDLPLEVADYELAARFFNNCREAGIQGSHTDFLICAVAHRFALTIFSVDRDFSLFVEHIPIKLHSF